MRLLPSKRFTIRWSYFLAVAAFLAYCVDSFTAGTFYLRGEGLVVGELAMVATEFNVTIRDVNVREGQEINVGDVLVTVSSHEVQETRARLASDAATRASRVAELSVRNAVVNATIQSAESREQITTDGNARLSQTYKDGYLPVVARNAAAVEAYRGKQDAETLRAEKVELSKQIPQLNDASKHADEAYTNLVKMYDDGKMRSPIKGTVRTVLAHRGAVIKGGEALVEIVGAHKFVLAWFPVGRYYDIEENTKVTINPGGSHSNIPGYVSRVGTIASSLPKEYQKSFAPQESRQLVWIEFDQGVEPPPYFTKVMIK